MDMTQEEKDLLLKDTEFDDECYDFIFKLIQNNKKQLGLDDNYIGVPKVIYELCMICCQHGYNKAKEETSNKMTQEEKDLLLKDLCARLPYGRS